MNSKRFLRKTFLSILLVTAILLGSFSSCLTVYAVEASGEALAELGAADTGLTVEKLVLSEDDVPEVIDFAEAQEKGHVLRLRSKESDDNTVVFLNDDNTETMYLFAEPVKYTDEHGNIKDKSTALTLSDGAYTMAQNDVKVRFARDISKGVTVNKGGVNITMTPVSTTVNSGKLNADSNAEFVSVNENKITYSNVFQSAELVYTTLYSGFKEDIVLESYDGINEFAFIVNTNGLYPVKQENGAVYFFEPNTDELVAKMMQVVCYDSAYNFAEGDVRITEVKANQIYGFTVVADSAFLTDENTVYPVYVDPTITLNTESTIEDAVVYSGKPTRNYGDHRYSTIGYLDSSYGVGRLMVRFPTLSTDTNFAAINDPDTIISAKYYIFTASGGSSSAAIRPYGYNRSSWTESTVTWNNITVGSTLIMMDAVTVPSGGAAKTEIDVTNAVQAWVDDSVMGTPEQGILFMNTSPNDATLARDFLNVEYALSSDSRSGYMPNLVINYGTTTNTVSIVLEDDDDVDNGKIELKAGRSDSFIAKLYHNGNLISGGTLLTFQSLETSVADIPTATVATVRGISVGTAAIRATYSGQPRATESIIVEVWQEIYNVCSDEADMQYDYYLDTETDCDVNAYIKIEGVYGEYDEGITYSIDQQSYCVNQNQLTLNSSTGEITLNSDCDYMTEYPAGYLVVKAEYKAGGQVRAHKYIKVNIHNDDVDNSELTMQNGTYIRVNYPRHETHEHIFADNICYGCLTDMHASDFEVLLREDPDRMISENFNYGTESHNLGWLIDSNENEFFEYIRDSKVAVILTHGSSGSFVVNGSNTNDENGRLTITTEDILSLHQGYFSECELIICLFCSGGAYDASETTYDEPTEMGIVEAFVDRGAQRAVGFVNPVSFSELDVFMSYISAYLSGYNIEKNLYNLAPLTYKDSCLQAFGQLELAQGSAITVDSDEVTALDGTTLERIYFKADSSRELILVGREDINAKMYLQ